MHHHNCLPCLVDSLQISPFIPCRQPPLHKKMKFSIIDFFSKCDHIWSHLLKISVMESFIFCAVPREKPVPSNHLDSHCYCIPWHVNSFVGLCNLLLGSEKVYLLKLLKLFKFAVKWFCRRNDQVFGGIVSIRI